MAGRSPLRAYGEARGAPLESFGGSRIEESNQGPRVLETHERLLSIEKPIEKPIERTVPVQVPRLVEKVVERGKHVECVTTHERPVVQYVNKVVQIVREVPVEKIVEKPFVRKIVRERIIEQVVEIVKEVPVERIIEQVVEVEKEVPVEKVVERIHVQEVPVIETEERVVEVVREIPVEIVKEVPVYIKIDPAEWESRHSLRSTSAIGGVGLRLERFETGPQTGTVYVVEVVPGSPAADCGVIKLHDLLVSVDGRAVEKYNLQELHQMIRGPAGTPVVLEFKRTGRQNQQVTLYRMSQPSYMRLSDKEAIGRIVTSQELRHTGEMRNGLSSQHTYQTSQGIDVTQATL